MFWQDKLLIPLNAFPILTVLLACDRTLGNPFAAAGTAGLIVNLLSYVNLVKTDCRNDPFIPADIGLVREAVNAAGEYTLNLHIGTLAGHSGARRPVLPAGGGVSGEASQVAGAGDRGCGGAGGLCVEYAKGLSERGALYPRGRICPRATCRRYFGSAAFPIASSTTMTSIPSKSPKATKNPRWSSGRRRTRSEYTKPGVQPECDFHHVRELQRPF